MPKAVRVPDWCTMAPGGDCASVVSDTGLDTKDLDFIWSKYARHFEGAKGGGKRAEKVAVGGYLLRQLMLPQCF